MTPKTDIIHAKALSNLPLPTIPRLVFTYVGVVFATGFFFGTIRRLYVIPKYNLPPSNAEIIEAPLMFIAVIIWANWLVNHYKIPAKAPFRITVGLLGLGVMACLELIGGIFVGDRGPAENGEGWTGIARALYLFNFILFGIMPWILTLIEKE
ncbi:uncharacterized protein B0J16DRAFT_351654 [Fusarium flagelliforme]|uniref:uncharacterized protein n=1 Tax=Fusarium flagelliforme TaxID=2675880 RepID=UPI001E8CC3B8|nr:uncharacterized protein B0J16DRAFT_351654 [Fusarium flagelliforme]KAH7169849.1 hypothetical protein B0J16DRAFT_351654 [Fusarium flagelliforme]